MHLEMETDVCFQDTGKEPKRSSGFHASLPTYLSWEADTGICVAITDGVPGSKSTVSWASTLRAHLA